MTACLRKVVVYGTRPEAIKMGRSKQIGERLVTDATSDGGTYLSVRFGNVPASRGSALTTCSEQLGQSGPITVTHPEVTRFFMTIPEAVVIQTVAVGRPGEALVRDMGDPIRILDVAHQLMEVAGQGVDIVYTGLREGEELFGEGAVDERPTHPAISDVDVPALGFARARRRTSLVGVEAALVDLLADAPRRPGLDDLLASAPVAATTRGGR